MLDPVITCAMTIKSNPGSYALFLGSGVSFSSKIPTGWDVTMDLVRKIALANDEKPEDHYDWFIKKYGKEPNYSELLTVLAKTPLERSKLLQEYFEPTEQDKQLGHKLPTPAHRAIAKLIEKDRVKVVVTTNFDRLLEKALHELDINPVVIKSSDDLEGIPSLAHLKNPLIIKLNGDYLDIRFKNTIEELSNYDSKLTKQIIEIFNDYGLIVCGWSAKWDLELVNKMLSSNSNFSTFWVEPGNLSENAQRIIEKRDATTIQSSSDNFFPKLHELITKLSPKESQDEKSVLPFYLTNFIKRPEFEKTLDLLKNFRMITLVGAGGSGKTRLAVEVSKELIKQDKSIKYIDLTNCIMSEDITSKLLSVYQVRDKLNHASLDIITKTIGDSNDMIVLDNCETVIDSIKPIIGAILSGCPNIVLLLTSRQVIGIDGEITLNLSMLSTPPDNDYPIVKLMEYGSICLFNDRAKTVNPSFQLTEQNKKAVVEICKKLDGLPLAIELAATRIKMFSADAVLEKLKDRFSFLSNLKSDENSRHKTLKTTIDWSYNLLSQDEKNIFKIISVFPSSFSIDALSYLSKYIGYDEIQVIDLVQNLIDKSLLNTFEIHYNTRFKLLESIKEYIKTKTEPKDCEHYTSMLSEWAIIFVSSVYHLISETNDHSSIFSFYDIEYDNIRYSLEYFESINNIEKLLVLSEKLIHYWNIRGYLNEGIRWLECLKRKCKDDQMHGKLLPYCITLSSLYIRKGEFIKAEAILKEIESSKIGFDNPEYKSCYSGLGNLYYTQGNYSDAKFYLEKYLSLIDDSADSTNKIKTLKTLSMISGSNQEYEKGINYLKQIIDECEQKGNKTIKAYALGNIGYFYGEMDMYEESKKYHGLALDQFRELENNTGIVSSLFNIGNINLYLNNYTDAYNVTKESLALATKIDDKDTIISSTQNLGIIDMINGNYIEAEQKLLYSLKMSKEIINKRREAVIHKYLGDLYLLKNDLNNSVSNYCYSIDYHLSNNLHNEIFFSLEKLYEFICEKDYNDILYKLIASFEECVGDINRLSQKYRSKLIDYKNKIDKSNIDDTQIINKEIFDSIQPIFSILQK